MSVPAGVVRDPNVPAGITGVSVSAERRSAAGLYMTHDATLGSRWDVRTPELVSVFTENVCDLELRSPRLPDHLLQARTVASGVPKRSSGLRVRPM